MGRSVRNASAGASDLFGEWLEVWSQWDSDPSNATYYRIRSDEILSELSANECDSRHDAAERLEIALMITTGHEPDEDVGENKAASLIVSTISYLRRAQDVS